jgi:hypothetical protein
LLLGLRIVLCAGWYLVRRRVGILAPIGLMCGTRRNLAENDLRPIVPVVEHEFLPLRHSLLLYEQTLILDSLYVLADADLSDWKMVVGLG